MQFCGNTQHDIMFSNAAKLLKYFSNDPAKDVVDLRSEIPGCVSAGPIIIPQRRRVIER